MTIELRGHHFLCLLTYVGNGYNPAFARAYDGIVERLNAGESIRVVSGADAICQALIANDKDPHCFTERVRARDRRAAADVGALLGHEIAEGAEFELTARSVALLRDAFAQETIRGACHECPWSRLCTRVARAEYPGVRLLPPEPAV
ncbi:hypothetical protein C8N35_1011167 [Breoghania corrubedonensis]|uniref:DUF1284 domain-containing protein n=1 Tax=Breoghania corrubedonensis TaxID=665038 RepID=A0A2T5VH91_9HYPH|nr:DUF1284 domain-containing protein [Breoghania corrubedonensis]PTW63117.1 hypothetical protein C8N35_1011167 [Breoghania corrubedonensis]